MGAHVRIEHGSRWGHGDGLRASLLLLLMWLMMQWRLVLLRLLAFWLLLWLLLLYGRSMYMIDAIHS